MILKYHDIELHFGGKSHHGLYLIYSDDEIEFSITAEHEEMLQPITNTEPVDNEFFLKDGAVYFSGLYENGLLKGVAPKDFCCWHYWGKSSTACFLGGIRLRGGRPGIVSGVKLCLRDGQNSRLHHQRENPDVELAAFQVLRQRPERFGCAPGICKGQPETRLPQRRRQGEDHQGRGSFLFPLIGRHRISARDEKRIYAYGKQLPKAELTSWELIGHWYSRDAKRVYYLNREIKGADRDSFTVCTPFYPPLLADHLARDKDHFYQNDEIMEETQWLEQLRKMTQEP